MVANIIMFLCRLQYKKYHKAIFYIKGTKEKYPRYLLYTEDKNVYERMDKF